MKKKYNYIIVGSGAGGGALAAFLSQKHKLERKKILVIEAGPFIPKDHLGNFWNMVVFNGYYSKLAAFNMSQERVTIYNTKNVGGTTVVACGNMVRSCQKEFARYGIDLEHAFKEAESDIKIVPCETVISGTKTIMDAANRVGEKMIPMAKGRYPNMNCNACKDCVLGCSQEAKWDAMSYIRQAIENGAEIIHSTKVNNVVFHDNGKVKGVQIGNDIIEGEKVILAAGALNTPVILQSSGIEAGHGLFVDYFNVTYGIVDRQDGKKAINQLKGASMGAVITDYHESDGFILSPFLDHWSQQILMVPMWWNIIYRFPRKKLLGIMTKITDERVGRVFANGKVSKTPTKQDLYRLNSGAAKARSILEEAGARSIVTTSKWHRGAHPGGTAAIGEVLDKNLMLPAHEGLYVCDASVFPVTPGLPPILTIIAFAKWLGTKLTDYQ